MARRAESDEFRFDGFEGPNTTPVPDVVFDRLLARLGEAELKALLYIIRRTFGFKKSADPISFNQFLRGIANRDGKPLDEGCGVRDRTTLSKALKSLEAKGIVLSEKGVDERGENITTVYRLRFKDEPAVEPPRGVVGNPYHPDEVVGNAYHRGMNSRLPVVGNSYPQETVKQQTAFDHSNLRMAPVEKRTNEGGEAAANPEPAADGGNDSANAGSGPAAPPRQETLTRSSQNAATASRRAVSAEFDANENRLHRKFDDSGIRMAQTDFALGEWRQGAPSNGSVGIAPAAETTAPAVLPLGEAITLWRARQQAPEPGLDQEPDIDAPLDRAEPGPVPESDGDRPHPRAPRRRRQEDPDYQLLQNVMRDLAREFHDRAPLGSTTTRAHNLWRRSGLGIQVFVDKLYAARAVVKERTPAIRATGNPNAAGFSVKHGIGYFFAVVEDLCGLRASEPGNPGE